MNSLIFIVVLFPIVSGVPLTIEEKCLDCVRNGTLGFYKTIWMPRLPPEYVCSEKLELESRYGIIVELACTVKECEKVETRPISHTYPRGSTCNNTEPALGDMEVPITSLDLPPFPVRKPNSTPYSYGTEVVVWLVVSFALWLEALIVWYAYCTSSYVRNFEKFRKSRHVHLHEMER